jgi:hypothetical protein
MHNSGIPKSIEHIIKIFKNQFQFYYHKILTLFRWQELKINVIHGFVKNVFICSINDLKLKLIYLCIKIKIKIYKFSSH